MRLHDLWRGVLVACVLATCGGPSRAEQAATPTGGNFPDFDQIETARGDLLKGKIRRVTADQVVFLADKERAPVAWPVGAVTIKFWAGVSDAQPRLDYALSVQQQITKALAQLPETRTIDARGLLQAADKATKGLNRVESVKVLKFNTEASAKSAQRLAAALWELEQDALRPLDREAANMAALKDLIEKADGALGRLNAPACAQFLSQAARILARVPPEVARLYGLQNGKNDLAKGIQMIGDWELDALGPAAGADLASLGTLRTALDRQQDLLMPDLPALLRAKVSQEDLRQRVRQRKLECDALWAQTEEVRKAIAAVQPKLDRLKALGDEPSDASKVLTGEIQADLDAVASLKVGEKSAPAVAATVGALRKKFESFKDARSRRELAGRIAQLKAGAAKVRTDYAKLLGDLSEPMTDERAASVAARAGDARKGLTPVLAGLSILAEASTAADDEVLAIRAQAVKVDHKLEQLVQFLAAAQELFRAEAAAIDDSSPLDDLRNAVEAVQSRLRELSEKAEPEHKDLAAQLEARIGQAHRGMAYRADLRRVRQLAVSIESRLAAGQLAEARQGLRQFAGLSAKVAEEAAAAAVTDTPDFATQQAQLQRRLQPAIASARKNAGWMAPTGGDQGLVPPVAWNRWQAFRLALAGDQAASAEAVLDDLERKAADLPGEWSARVPAARAAFWLAQARKMAADGDQEQQRRLLQATVEAAPGSAPARSAALALVRMDDEVRAAQLWRSKLLVLQAVAGVFGAAVLFLGAVAWWRRPSRVRRRVESLLERAVAAAGQGDARRTVTLTRRARRAARLLGVDDPKDVDLRSRALHMPESPPRDVRREIRQRLELPSDEAAIIDAILSGARATPESAEVCLKWLEKSASADPEASDKRTPHVIAWLSKTLEPAPAEGQQGAVWREALATRAAQACRRVGSFRVSLGDNALRLEHYDVADAAFRGALRCSLEGPACERTVIGLAKTFLHQQRVVEAVRFLRGLTSNKLVLPGEPPADATRLCRQLAENEGMNAVKRWLGMALGQAIRDHRTQNPAASAARALAMLFPPGETQETPPA